jgi:DNA-binding response OmpR family regulator
MSEGRILVVDDELEVRLVLGEFLGARGYDVQLAESGMRALEIVEEFNPQVVLLDVTMPEMDGVETLRQLLEVRPGLSVIMVTANSDVGTTSKLLALGAADYIPKPFDLDYLDQAISIQVSAAQE